MSCWIIKLINITFLTNSIDQLFVCWAKVALVSDWVVKLVYETFNTISIDQFFPSWAIVAVMSSWIIYLVCITSYAFTLSFIYLLTIRVIQLSSIWTPVTNLVFPKLFIRWELYLFVFQKLCSINVRPLLSKKISK